MQNKQPIVPREFAGKWVAWDRLHKKIIASGRTFAEVRREAKAAGESRPELMKVPRGLFVG